MIKEFFKNDTEKVAKKLLGCTIQKNGLKGKIVETEAYLEQDPASHAHPEKTERNRLMYETYGHVYIYKCYGLHNMLNFTTEKQSAGGVLIRSLKPVKGIEQMKQNRGIQDKQKLCDGPGKICEALKIDKEMKGTKVGEQIQIQKGQSPEIRKTERIGISKAQNRKLRYHIKNNKYVSQT
jgi:DNA-3-methyladenine glycosylase